jgi:hypothetical protein
MASYADAFGYTPAEFMELTLPQLNAFAKHAEQRDAEMKGESSSSSPSKNRAKFVEAKDGNKNIGSLEQMIQVFGKPGAK